ncbi:MAG: hypothetical protein QOF70_2775 [Acetobacteraceae bacterium]|jgi:CheY-like chemotaxis protein|nr:hypothetical protein [Acetobacteraceae bacterium]
MIDAPNSATSAQPARPTGIGQSLVLLPEESGDLRRHLDCLPGNDRDEVVSADDDEAKLFAAGGLLAAGGRKYGLVLSDVMLPWLIWFVQFPARRREPGLPNLPATVLSACESEEARAACLRAGADGYLAKHRPARDLLPE